MLLILLALFLGMLFVFFASAAEGTEIVERYIEKDPTTKKQLNKKWHTYQLLERGFAIMLGYSLALLPFLNALATMLLISAMFWIFYDGTINIAFNRDFLHRSTTGTSWFDKLAYPSVKLSALVIAVILFYFLLGT